MRLTVFAAGSQGDIQPCVVLCRALQAAGYRVRLAAPQDFAAFAGRHGVDFAALRGDVQQIMASDTGRSLMESGGANPLRSIRAIRALIEPVVLQMAADAYAACQDADGLVCLGVFSAFGQAISEALRIPQINLEPTPLLPSRAFPAPSWPVQRSLGGLHNYVSGLAMLGVVWLWYQPFVNAFRRRLELPVCGARGTYRTFRATPLIGAYSPAIIPQPPDWPASARVSGYLFLDPPAGWQPPAGLEAFLQAGPPPVYVGFGSMSGRRPEELAGLVLQALALSGQRGLLLTGWGALQAQRVPESVYVLESAPHAWLFPRMAAVVHHGGAGTTAEGLRAGVPSIIVPFIFDQPFWGRRVQAAGLGPAPIAQKALSAEKLAAAIQAAVGDPALQARARAVGAAIRQEDGAAQAVALVERYLGAGR